MKPAPGCTGHPGLSLALETFRREQLRRPDPILAILGPPGSGKSDLLHELIRGANSPEMGWTGVCVDLLGISIGTEREMYQALLGRLQEGLLDAGFHLPRLAPDHPAAGIRTLIVDALRAATGRLLLVLDHLDAVPRLFADSVSQLLRSLKESQPEGANMDTLALLVAGTLSLTELAASSRSAFHGARVVHLPVLGGTEVRSYVQEFLGMSGVEVADPQLVDALIEATRGERCFLDVVVRHLRQDRRPPSRELVEDCVSRIRSHEIPHLRHAALHMRFNRELAEIARQVLAGNRVARRSRTVDIDEHQLTGVVVLDHSERPSAYAFRNGLIRRLAQQVLPSATATLPDTLPEVDLRVALLDLAAAQQSIHAAGDLAECTGPLHAAWDKLTGLDQPVLHIVVSDLTHEHVEIFEIPPTGGIVSAAVRRAAAGSHRTRCAYFETDGDRVSFAQPLPAPSGMESWLVSTIARPNITCTEYTLAHWRTFAVDAAPALVRLALASALKKTFAPAPREVQVREVKGTAQLYFNSELEVALLSNGHQILSVSGRTDRKWEEWVKKVDSEVAAQRKSRDRFESEVRRAGDDLDKMLENYRGLTGRLHEGADLHHWVISTPLDSFGLPFELLTRQGDQTPLLIRTGVARRVEGYKVPAEIQWPFSALLARLRRSGDPLRVLLAGADPDGTIDAGKELSLVRQAIEQNAAALKLRAEIVVIGNCSAAALEAALQRERPFQLFHFAGHADHDEGSGRGYLTLDRQGNPENVEGSQLKAWLLDAGVWLCYLSACRTARETRASAIRNNGLFDEILGAGVPNLVGFRWPVTAASATALAEAFYTRLLEPPAGSDPTVAMLHARRVARGREAVSDAWASSILVTQCVP